VAKIDCECAACVMKKVLPNHPNYIRDFDDDFDSTYAYIVFSVPKEYEEFILKLVKDGSVNIESLDVGSMFQQYFEDFKKNNNPKGEKDVEKI
jgi:hypothetical protein